MPKVSVCLPNLNNRPYLEVRLQSIYEQTLEDWELIIIDNHSDDGAWELFQEHAKKEPRIKLSQAPKEGMYANWNNTIREATGDYIYIATSDDSMMPECLEKLAAALDRHPDCGIAHCNLMITGPDGKEVFGDLWKNYLSQSYYGDLLNHAHIRRAPHDAFLHFTGYTVYHSITQVLLRRSLFETIGPFPNEYGSAGDYGWEMKAAFFHDCVHVPETLATWRKHDTQATQPRQLDRCLHYRNQRKMAEMALDSYLKEKPQSLSKGLVNRLWYPLDREQFIQDLLANRSHPLVLLQRILHMMIRHPQVVLDVGYECLFRRSGQNYDPIVYIKKWYRMKRTGKWALSRAGVDDGVELLP